MKLGIAKSAPANESGVSELEKRNASLASHANCPEQQQLLHGSSLPARFPSRSRRSGVLRAESKSLKRQLVCSCVLYLRAHQFARCPIIANAVRANGGAVFFERLVGKNKAGLRLLWVDSNKEGEPGRGGRSGGQSLVQRLAPFRQMLTEGMLV